MADPNAPFAESGLPQHDERATTAKRKDIVIIMVQYDRDVPEEVLGIHENVEGMYEGVVSVRAEYGNATGQVGQVLGKAPARFAPPISQR